MKYIIILGDGMADWPVKSLGDKTLLQYAKTPYMDKLARMGRNGRLITVAEGFHPGSEVANMSVLGYNLPKVYEGRGPLEAASIGDAFNIFSSINFSKNISRSILAFFLFSMFKFSLLNILFTKSSFISFNESI